jgi:putative endonuclease
MIRSAVQLRSVALFNFALSMSFTVYAINSKSLDIIYVGQTNNIEKRLKSHLFGYSKYTSRAKDWILFYSENIETRAEAMKREKQLKSSRGRAFLGDKL